MFFSQAPIAYLLVFLGNPGDQYENTRHNVGWMVGDELARRQNAAIKKLNFRALTAKTVVGGQSVLLLKPVTYMNLSGESAGAAARFYKVPPAHVLVVSDDVSLPVGKLRLRQSGSAGGHNGLKSIEQHLGTDGYPRLKVGVGEKPHPNYDLADWVLGKFVGADKKQIDAVVASAADAIEVFLKDGPDAAMGKFN